MAIRKIKLSKQFKKGLPNYSNITAGIEMEWELKDDERFDFDEAWNIINRELNIQGNDTQYSFFKHEELKDFHKVTIKVPNKVGDNYEQ